MLTERIIITALILAVLYTVKNMLLDRVKSEEKYNLSQMKKGKKVIEKMDKESENIDNDNNDTKPTENAGQKEE